MERARSSDISLAEVAARITKERALRALKLTDRSMREAGFDRPRIAVAGLNPHAVAKNGAFDAVLTMYHDQGQIAVKLMGFDRGLTLHGGFGFPTSTPAHGTAYDIAG